MNSNHAYQQLIDSGKLSDQQQRILECFQAEQVLSTKEIKHIACIDRVNTVGARCGELIQQGILVGVGRKKHGSNFYTTYRLAKSTEEAQKAAKEQARNKRVRPLQAVINGNYSEHAKRAAEQEIDRINHLNDVA